MDPVARQSTEEAAEVQERHSTAGWMIGNACCYFPTGAAQTGPKLSERKAAAASVRFHMSDKSRRHARPGGAARLAPLLCFRASSHASRASDQTPHLVARLLFDAIALRHPFNNPPPLSGSPSLTPARLFLSCDFIFAFFRLPLLIGGSKPQNPAEVDRRWSKVRRWFDRSSDSPSLRHARHMHADSRITAPSGALP